MSQEFQISLNVKSFQVIILGKENLSEYLQLSFLKLVLVLFLSYHSFQKKDNTE